MKVALLQITSSDDPAENLPMVRDMLREAANQGAEFALTPEVTNCVSSSRTHQREVLSQEEDDLVLAGLSAEAKSLGLWVLIGSLGIQTGDLDGRFANRSFLIGADGTVQARYDKIHMFDVDVSETETYRESAAFRPGNEAVLAQTPWGQLGMTICYDVRFAYLHRALAQAGARIITVPAAFSPVTGAAHWEVLLRARAIETGCWILAPAQTGDHKISRGKPRSTYGHSLVIAPWGEVILDAGTDPGVYVVDVDMNQVAKARHRVPALTHDRSFRGPNDRTE